MARLFLLLLCIFPATADIIDGVVAVVDRDIILLSELNEITRLTMAKEASSLSNQSLFREKRRLVLRRMIDDRVLLARAKAESVEVSSEEVEELLARQLTALRKGYGGEEALGRVLQQQYGLSVAKLKRQYRKDIRENLLKQRFHEKRLRKTTVNREEVQAFFRDYQDSLPMERASIHLSHLQVIAKSTQENEKKARLKIEEIRQKLSSGGNFSALAFQFSEGPNAKDSGDIGTFKKGGLGLPEFERAAFSLQSDETGPVVRSRLGYHLIRMLDRTDREVHVRHIVIRVEPSEEEYKQIHAFLDSLKQVCTDSASFAVAVARHSDDKNTVQRGGVLGWYTRERLSRQTFKAVADLEPGSISEPLRIGSAFHLFRVNQSAKNRKLNLQDDYADLEKLAGAEKAKTELTEEIERWRKDFHIRIMLDEMESSSDSSRSLNSAAE